MFYYATRKTKPETTKRYKMWRLKKKKQKHHEQSIAIDKNNYMNEGKFSEKRRVRRNRSAFFESSPRVPKPCGG